ncbi:MAG: ABC transporter substrate-binding protein [Dehalococcoidia bacterium]
MTPVLTPAAPVVGPIEDATRREFVRLVGGGAFAGVILVACGQDDGEDEVPATRTIETAFGPVAIPTRPERVVTVVNYAMNALFSLGVTPAGVPDGFEASVLPSEVEMYRAAPKVGPWNEIDVEQVAALNPDLILGLDIEWNTPLREALSATAPTALFALEGTSDWAKVTEQYADAMGLLDEFDVLEQRYHGRAAEVRASHETVLASTRFAIANEFQQGWVLWYPDSSGAQVLAETGIQFFDEAAGKTGNYEAFSLEQVNKLEGANAILIRSTGGTLSENTQAFLALDVVRKLPAVVAGRVFPIANLFPTSYTQALALVEEAADLLGQL